MFNSLVESLDKSFRDLRGVGKISEKNIEGALREIRLALIDADVEYSVAKAFISTIKDRALGADVLKSIKPGEQIVKIFHDELTVLLGGDHAPLNLDPPAYIMMVGLNGAGKTTTSAKLARRLKKDGKKPLLVACDLYRPAAIDQLATLAKQVQVPCYKPEATETDLVKVAKDALEWAKTEEGDVLIFDTAGRQEIDSKLIDELKDLHAFVQPGETLLVADAATGQQAVSVAQSFDDAVGIDGIVLTKLDGDARGGAALSMRAITGKPIKYMGEGEKMENFAEFHPERMAGRILDMGDVVSMVEDVADKVNADDAMDMMKQMRDGNFDFNTFLAQMRMIRKLGPLDKILGMLPGMRNLKKQLPMDVFDNKKMKHMEAIVLSMTPKERARPIIINPSRRRRIANGSGTTVIEVNRLLKNFSNMKKMMKNKGKMKQMMQTLGGNEMANMGMDQGLPDLENMSDSDLEKMLTESTDSNKKGMPKGGPSLEQLSKMQDLLKQAGKGKGGFPF